MKPTRRARARHRRRPPPAPSASPDTLYHLIAKPNQRPDLISFGRTGGKGTWRLTSTDGGTERRARRRRRRALERRRARVLPSASARQCCLYCAWPGGRRQHGYKALLGQVAVQQVQKSHGPSASPRIPAQVPDHTVTTISSTGRNGGRGSE
jgi:hypothetical protein